MSDYPRHFTHISIPADIWLRKDISPEAKFLWAEITSFHRKENDEYFVSEEHLLTFFKFEKSQLHKFLKQLTDAGLIEKVNFEGSLNDMD